MGIFKRKKDELGSTAGASTSATDDMQKGKKPKKALWKRILKWTGISFLVLLILLIAAPFLFKPQIIRLIEKAATDNLNAKVEIGDADLSIFSSFPNFTLKLYDVKVDGVGEFDGITLADLPQVEAKMNFWSVVGGGKYTVKKLKLIDPKIHIVVTEEGKANYDITIPDSSKTDPEEEVPFQLALTDYSIENGEFIYDDKYYDTYVELKGMNHSGKMTINGDVYDMSTHTDMKEFTLEYDEVAYIHKAKTNMDADLQIDMTEDMVLKFMENQIMLNELKLHADGAFVMDDRGYKFDEFHLSADESSFANFMSMIPTPYQVDLGDLKTDGTLALKAHVNGYYADNAMPAMAIDMMVNNAMVQYPGMPSNISSINVDAHVNKPDESLSFDGMVINVKRLDADFAGNTLRSSLNITNPESDPNIAAKLLANIDLESLKTVIPMPEGEELSGKIKSDVEMAGRLSSIENEQYEQFKAKGDLLITQMHYKSADLSDVVDLDSLDFQFSPQYLALKTLNARIGKNDFQADGKIDNYLAYYFKDELLKGEFNLRSNYLNADDFMTETSEESAEVDASDSSENNQVIPVPANIDFQLHTSLKEVIYDGISITNVKGDVHVKDQAADLQNLSLNALGGSVVMNGLYDTKNADKPHVEMGYELKSINIAEAASAFMTIEKLAPIAKYCEGMINSSFQFNGDLSANLEPIYESLTGDGTLSSSSVEVAGFKPLEKLSSVLNRSEIAQQTFKNINMAFEFKDGKVFVNPFNVNLGKAKTEVSGNTSFEQDIDYTMATFIPKSSVPKSAIAAAEKAMGAANGLGLNLGELPNEIPVNVLLKGKVTDPEITTDLQEKLLELTGNLTDQLKDKLNETKDSIINEVKDKVDDKIDEVKDDLKERRDKILADAQIQADKIKAAGKASADKARLEADKAYDEAIAAAGNNPIKKKAAQVVAQKAKDKAYEKADQIEEEANQKADKLMEEAHEKANKLE